MVLTHHIIKRPPKSTPSRELLIDHMVVKCPERETAGFGWFWDN